MNANILVIAGDLWSLTGWTMVHFLWLGAIVAAFAFAGRVILRSAAPNARYSFALMCLALLTAMPLVAAWFANESALALVLASAARPNLPPSTTSAPDSLPLKGGAGGGIPSDANALTTAASPTPPIIELHTPSSDVAATAATVNSPPLKGGAGEGIPDNASQPSTLNPRLSRSSTLAPRSSPPPSPTSLGSGLSARR